MCSSYQSPKCGDERPRQGGVEAPGVGGGTAGDGGPGDPRHLPAGPGGGQEPQAAGQESSVEAAEDGLGDTRGDFSCRVYVF